MTRHFQRIATLLLAASFVLQTLAVEDAAAPKDDKAVHMSTGKVMTLTFQNPGQYLTVTLPGKFDPTPAPDSENALTNNNKGFEVNKQQQEEELQQHVNAEQELAASLLMEEAERQQRQREQQQQQGGEFVMDDYMGEEIDQILDDTVGQAGTDLKPSASMAAGPAAVSAMAANKTSQELTAPTGPRPPMPQVTGCKTQGQIALTYSEGPSDVTAKIVRQLTKADAKANFFVNATWLYTQQYAMVVQNIYNAGHFIGMTYRVPNDDTTSLTDDQLRQDILNDAHIIETLIQVSPKYVRLHYTEQKDVRTEGILRDLGFVIVGYNLDSQDYFRKDATGPNSITQIYSDTFKKYKDTYDAKGSFISIQYDLPYTGSLAAIPHIINTIDEEGYTMVRLDGCLNDPNPYKKSANSTEYIGDKFSFSGSGYHHGQKSIVIETPAEAAADEELKIQGMEGMEVMEEFVKSLAVSNTQLSSFSIFLVVVGAIFTLFL